MTMEWHPAFKTPGWRHFMLGTCGNIYELRAVHLSLDVCFFQSPSEQFPACSEDVFVLWKPCCRSPRGFRGQVALQCQKVLANTMHTVCLISFCLFHKMENESFSSKHFELLQQSHVSHLILSHDQ
jgi:hypothetical protein